MKQQVYILFLVALAISTAKLISKTPNGFTVQYNKEDVKADDWWRTAVFYQIYPRSFKDSNNDGIGDLQGIISKLPYLHSLNVTAIWLSPIFKSPQVDQGYDISDYRTIEPDYGTMDDLMTLIASAHDLGIRVILDFVPNHTSNEHAWFKESENNRTGPFGDFYVWSDGVVGNNNTRQPPNNWLSVFGGSAWTWSDVRKQYFFHQFAPAQPDLNYRSSAVVEEMKDVMTYWLEMGVDGFRIDAVPHLFEDLELRDEPLISENGDPNNWNDLDHIYTKDQNGTYDMIYQWREHIDAFSAQNGAITRVLMTEAYTSFENTILYFGTEERDGAHFSFNFDLISIWNVNSNTQDLMKLTMRWSQEAFFNKKVTPNWVIGNHDNHRVATRLGPLNVDGWNMLVALLEGIQVTYNGEEIGQENGEVTCEQGKDPSAIKDCSTFDAVSRDFERTPFQWDDSINAGFNDGGEPWLPVSEKKNETNLAKQEPERKSHYNIYKEIISIRDIFNQPFDSITHGTGAIGEHSIQVVRLIRPKNENQTLNYNLIFNFGDVAEDVLIQNTPGLNMVKLANAESSYGLGDEIDVDESEPFNLQAHEALLLFRITYDN